MGVAHLCGMVDAMAVDRVGGGAVTEAKSETIPDKPTWVDDPNGIRFKLEKSLAGHSKAVACVKFSPDGTRLASASADKTVKIWTTNDGTCLATLTGHAKGCSDVVWTKCGRYVVSCSDDKNLHLWCVDPSLRNLNGDGFGVNDKMEHVDTMDDVDTTLDKVDTPIDTTNTPIKYGQCLRVFVGHTAHVFCCDISPAGNILASGSCDETVRLWDVNKGTCMNVLPAHSDPVTNVQFSHDGTVVVSASYDGLVRIWSIASGACLKTLYISGDGDGIIQKDGVINSTPPPVACVKFAPNDGYLLIGTLDNTLRLVDLTDKTYNGTKVVKTYKGHVNEAYCVFSTFASVIGNETKETYVVSGSEDGGVCLWELQSRRQVTRVLPGVLHGADDGTGEDAGSMGNQSEPPDPGGHRDAVVGVDFCQNKLVTCGLEKDKTIKVWRVEGR